MKRRGMHKVAVLAHRPRAVCRLEPAEGGLRYFVRDMADEGRELGRARQADAAWRMAMRQARRAG